MKRAIFAIFFVLALAFLLLDTDAIDYFRYFASGAKEAQRDIQQGHLEIRGYGLPARCTPEYRQLLKDRLGVTYRGVAGCSVSSPLRRHTNEYNDVMTHEIERRFGASVLKRLFDEAGRQHVARYAATRPAA